MLGSTVGMTHILEMDLWRVMQTASVYPIQVFNHKEILYMQFRPVYHPSHSDTLK